MAYFSFDNIRIAGIASAVPVREVKAEEYYERFGRENVDKFVNMTGVGAVRKSSLHQTASDLGFAAAEELLAAKRVDRSEIGALVFATLSPDYKRPSSACVLHKRLGLDRDCAAFDVGLGCSAFVYGAQIIGSVMTGSDIEKGLLIVGETMSKLSWPDDRASAMLFGDAGAAVLFEKREENRMSGMLCTDGDGYKAIMVPAGGFRDMEAPTEIMTFGDGNQRTLYNTLMDGTRVFEFTIRDVPRTIKDYMKKEGTVPEDYDSFIMHQANKYIHKQLQKRLKIEEEKMPLCLDRYGNTSAAAIPLTISDAFGKNERSEEIKMLMSGFGVGLSWGVMTACVNAADVLPVIETDDYFGEGIIRSPKEWEK